MDETKIPLMPDDMLRDAEARLKAGRSRREGTRRKLKQGRFQELDTPGRLQARVDRVKGDPGAHPTLMGIADEAELAPAAGVDDLLLERIIGGENFLGAAFFDLGKRACRCVARIEIRTPDGRSGTGTGSLVAPRLLLTNNHVLRDAEWARRSRATFDFEDDLLGNPVQTVDFDLDPDAFFFTHPGLDFTLVAVREQSRLPAGRNLSEYGFNPLDATQGKVAKGELINIIQHPSGLRKQVVLHDNRLLDLLDDWLHYEADTLPGSSGAPLFNNRWEVVGLHHAGWPNRDDQDRILAKNGQVWRPEQGEQAIDWLGNEGIRVSRILETVAAARATLSPPAQPLLDQLLQPPKLGTVVVPAAPAGQEAAPPPSTPEGGPRRRAEHLVQQSTLPPAPPVLLSGETTFTVPLQITVRFGAPDSSSGTVVPPSAPRSSAAALDQERAAAFRELAEAETRPYYDAAADGEARGAYYQDLDLYSSDKDALYDQLSALLSRTHTSKLSYKPSLHLYPWVDLQPDRKLISLYTGEVFEPERIIEEALALEAAFEARKEALLAEAAMGGPALEEALFLLEAGPAFNCEHVVPQSWFRGAGSNVPKGDLHHLFTCQMQCNSFRGNVPFWDFPDFQEALLQGCGRKEGNKFEPTQGKGPAARATLYFLLRYPGQIDDTASELQAERLTTLLAWHASEPIGEWERHRNAAIHKKQGNRNPLIDFPELAAQVNFVRGLRRGA